MNILMLSVHPTINSAVPKITRRLIEYLNNHGHRVTYEPWGCHTNLESLMNRLKGRALDILRIRSLLRKAPYDLMVVHTAHDWKTLLRDIPLVMLARRKACRVVLNFHGSQPQTLIGKGHFLFKWSTYLLIRMVDGALLLSSEECSQWTRFFPRGRYCLIRNPFVPEEIKTEGMSEAGRYLPEDKQTILFVGRLIRQKGVFDTLEAVRLLKESWNIHLVIAGEGPEIQALRNQLQKHDLSDRVTLAGYLTSRELDVLYRQCSIFVLPTYWDEGFPTVILEAMNAGLPLVTTAIRGTADHLINNVNVLFVPPRDSKSLSSAIKRLLTDKELRMKMGRENLKKIEEFSLERAGSEYLRALSYLCS